MSNRYLYRNVIPVSRGLIFVFNLQNVLMMRYCVLRVALMGSSLHVYLLTNVVITSLTVLEEKMNWITIVPVDLREQFV